MVEEFNGLAENFKQVRDAFLATYDEELTRWKAQHPGYERLIEAELLPKALVASKFAFGYDVFAINAVRRRRRARNADGAGRCRQPHDWDLPVRSTRRWPAESREFVRQSLTGRHEVTQKFLRPVRAIREKLAGLAFLDPGIAPLVGSIDEVLAAVPKKGKIDGASLAALRGVVTLLTDPARMREHGRLVLEGSGKGLLADAQAGRRRRWPTPPKPRDERDDQAEPTACPGGDSQRLSTTRQRVLVDVGPRKSHGSCRIALHHNDREEVSHEASFH